MTLYCLSTVGILAAVYLYMYPTFANLIQQISGNQIATNECFEKVIITLLLTAVAAIVLGNFVARNGLSKMREFSQKVENISASSLHERLDLNDWPKELRQMGEKFNTMLDRLHASFTQLSQFSSDIAHELRTPISNLRGATEVALAKEKSAEEYRAILEANLSEYEYLSKLIENLFFLARIDNGLLSIQQKNLNARQEIMNIVDYFQIVAEENNIEISCNGEANIFVEPILFRRIVNNLLSNALKYTTPNGKITININSSRQDYVQISFCDTGVGIAQEHLAKIFDRFYRIDPSRALQSGGLGLGLAIVKSIMDLHRGRVVIESKPGVGTAVNLFVPVLS